MSQRPLQRRERLYVDGDWLDADDALDVTDLADGGTFARVAAASPEQADAALAAAERFRRAKEEIRALKGEYREGTTAGHEGWDAIVKHEPMGTVLAITPYNYPLSTTALSVAPALVAGNAVILKPASDTPVSAAILADVVSEVDLPDGAFNFVPGRASVVGDVLSGDDRI